MAGSRTRFGWTRLVTLVVLIATIGSLSGVAAAEGVPPRPAHDRPRIGRVCPYWSQRADGDFSGDGRMDRAVFSDLADPTHRPQLARSLAAFGARMSLTRELARLGRMGTRARVALHPSGGIGRTIAP